MAGKGEINIGYLPTIYHTSFILMGLEWIEKKMNERADWRLFGSGPNIIHAFAEKTIDIGYLGLPPAIIGIDKGIPVKCVAGGHVEGTLVVAKSHYKSLEELGDLNTTLRQFEGKAIGAPRKGSIHDVIVRCFITDAGLEDSVSVRNFEWADFITEAILKGEIDAGVGTPPLAVVASRVCNTRIIIPTNRLWPTNPSYGIVAREELIESRPTLLRRFLELHKEACTLIREKAVEAAKIVSNSVGLVDQDFVLDVFKVSPKYCASISKEFIESTLAFLPVLRRLGYVSKTLTKEEIFDLRFIEEVHPEPPHH